MPDRIKVRTTVTGTTGRFISRAPGTRVGVQANTFVLDAIRSGLNGGELAPLLLDAMQPAIEEARAEWPVDTGASLDTVNLEVMEEGAKSARVALVAGGEQLISDPRNVSGKDYAPFIEFNGTATVSPGILTRAVFANENEIKDRLRAALAAWLESKTRG